MNNKTNSKYSFFILFLIALSAIGRFILITYGLPYAVHVDESTIIKDPVKILLTYKNFDFHLTYNLYNYLLLFWHGVTYIAGRLSGRWHHAVEYRNQLSIDAPFIIFSFRFLNFILSLIGDYVFLRFIFKKLNLPGTGKLLCGLIIILNPYVYNSVGFVKFDALCYVFYALLLAQGYSYFTEGNNASRNRLYFLLFLALSIRIEFLSFLIGFMVYDFWVIHKRNFASFFEKETAKGIFYGVGIYLLITLYPLTIIYNCFFQPKVSYTQTQSFEEVILSHLRLHSLLNYSFYVMNALVLFSPVIIVVFFVKIFLNNSSVLFLLPVLLIDNVVLAFDFVKDVWYFLLSAFIILFIFIKYAEECKHHKFSMVLLSFAFLYFLSYDTELLYYIKKHDANNLAQKYVLNHTLPKDTMVVAGVADLRIPQNPEILREQITALANIGGSTGYGLKEQLKQSESDSFQTRSIYRRDSDYFWHDKRYYQKWLIGYDTTRFKQLNPRWYLFFTNYNTPGMAFNMDANQDFKDYILKHYELAYSYPYHFADPRLYYRNYYYFHSFFIYKRK